MGKKICFISSSRSDYGLLSGLMKQVISDKFFNFQLLVTGMHFSKEYGLTYKEIVREKIIISKKIKIFSKNDNPESILKCIEKSIPIFIKNFKSLKPSIVILLGDRYEIIGPSIACNFLKIPIAHIHGGEVTRGSYDDITRHVVTKFSSLHFVTNSIYKKRVIQLGENPKNVHCVGSLGLESILKQQLYSKNYIEKKLNIYFNKKNLLVTYHPATNNLKNLIFEIKQILNSLMKLKDTLIIFTMPGLDEKSNLIINNINKFIKKNKNSILVKSLGQKLYFSTLKHMDGVIGNSSSGIIEVPYFNIGTINIGNRQEGRVRKISIIDCNPQEKDIDRAINTLYKKSFIKKIQKIKITNKKTSSEIINILKRKDFKQLLPKKFYDL